MMRGVSAIVLAGGKGTRMTSTLPKVLLEISKKPILFWCLSLLKNLNIEDTVVLVGYKENQIKREIKKMGFKNLKFVTQKSFLGTAYAVKLALKSTNDDKNTILVLFGDDSALYRKETLKEFIKAHRQKKGPITLLVSRMDSPSQIGGLKINRKGRVLGVLTKSELEMKKISHHYVLCGAFCFDRKWLIRNISQVPINRDSGEYPLPGVIGIARRENNPAIMFELENPLEWNSVNTPEELKEANRKMEVLLKNGKQS